MSKQTTKTQARRKPQAGTGKTQDGTERTRKARPRNENNAGASDSGIMDRASGLASEGAANLSRRLSGLLDDQIGHGAQMIGRVAGAARVAADDLEAGNPHMAGVVRSVADQIDDYADAMQDQSLEDIAASAAEFARRRPALTVGLAALVGFVAFRSLTSATSSSGRTRKA